MAVEGSTLSQLSALRTQHAATSRRPSNSAKQFDIKGDEYFRLRLERHLDDVRHGRRLESEVPEELQAKSRATNELFVNGDVRALSMYSGALTVLSYDRRARFINAVADASRHMNQIKNLAG